MNSCWHLFDPKQLTAGVIAVVATAESQPFWPGPIVSLLEEIGERCPSTKPDCAFLGGADLHPLEAVLRGIDAAGRPPGLVVPLEENLGRYPLLGPLMRRLETGAQRPVLVIAMGPVIDAEDWIVEPKWPIAFLRLTGSERIAPREFVEWTADDANFAVIAEFLADPLVNVRLGGDGMVAVEWHAKEYRWEQGRLATDQPPTQPVRVQFSGVALPRPRMTGQRKSGAMVDLPMRDCPPEPTSRGTATFSVGECVVLDLWRQRSPYWCAKCSQTHLPGVVLCINGENRLFPSLETFPPGTVCSVSRRTGGWVMETVPNGVLLLDDDRLCVWHGPRAALVTRDNSTWEPTEGTSERFIPVSTDQFALRI